MDYPSNSQERRPKEPPPKARKEIRQITKGPVTRRKKPLGKRVSNFFFGSDAKGVWANVFVDFFVPSLKDTVLMGIERMMFGDARARRSRNRSPYGSNGFVDYNRRYSQQNRPYGSDRDEPPRNLSRRSRARHDFDEIVLETRVEAEEVIDQLFELVSRFESASVADLYELVGIDSDPVDLKWGWMDLRGAGVTRVHGGYLLDLPRTEPLDQ